jgi:hypothetical protein
MLLGCQVFLAAFLAFPFCLSVENCPNMHPTTDHGTKLASLCRTYTTRLYVLISTQLAIPKLGLFT